MKQKMSLRQKIDLTRDGTAEMTRWCIIIALHQGFGVGSERLRKCAEDALKEDVVVQEVPDEERVKQSDRDYMAQKKAFFRRNMAAAMGRKLAPAGAAVLSEKGLDEKLQQLARLQQDGSGRPEELNRTWMGRKEGKAS